VDKKFSAFSAIFSEDDDLGLLAGKSAGPTRSTEDEIAIAQFEAINAFLDEHHVLPGSTADGREPNLAEYTLEAHLDAFRDDEACRILLSTYDRHGLLGAEAAPRATSLLRGPAEGIFELRHVPNTAGSKAAADDIERRRPCDDFATFEPIFALLKRDIGNGKRETVRFSSEASIKVGTGYILNGIMAYIADEIDDSKGRNRTRIRVIFGNGMEGRHLIRSFARLLHDDENGRQIIEKNPDVSGPLFSGQPDQADDFGEIAGHVYVVESKSPDPQILALRGRLYKIGFTAQPLEKRFSNAEKEAAFLYAGVHVVMTFATNFNPQKLEALVHQFFGNARLQIDITLGKSISPQEWFVVPLDLVEEAVNKIIDRSIVKYRYDHLSRKIVPK
jgi:hypothetical protein